MKKENIDVNSLAHTKWNCKYHIVFAPKYRRKVFYEEKRLEIREILGQLSQWKGEIIKTTPFEIVLIIRGYYEMGNIPVPARAGQRTGAPAMLLL